MQTLVFFWADRFWFQLYIQLYHLSIAIQQAQLYTCNIEKLYLRTAKPHCTDPCFHKMSFSKRNSGITWLARLTSWVSRGGLAVNHQMFNIWRRVSTKLCFRIDVTCTPMLSNGFPPEWQWWLRIMCKPGGQWGCYFSSHNTPACSHLQILQIYHFFSNNPSHIFRWYLLPLVLNKQSWGHCFLKT